MTKLMPISIDEETALWFRARRGHLAGPGASTPALAARAVLGFQSQKEAPALLGISQRTASRPSAVELAHLLRTEPRSLVRTWGQRDTLHIFDPSTDWADTRAAQAQWREGSRRGPMPGEDELDIIWQAISLRSEPFSKEVIFDILPPDFVERARDHSDRIGMDPIRFAATRFLWRLAKRGDLCLAGKSAAERLYAVRRHWFQELAWPDHIDPLEAAARLAFRYLQSYAPATPADIAHFFGARVAEVRTWLATFETQLVPVICGERRGLLALLMDSDELHTPPPKGKAWPLRLLPLWDGLLMGHKDKSWIVPNLKENKRIWRPGAYVAATVLFRGRIVATWNHKLRRGTVEVNVKPLDGWQANLATSVEKEAKAVARHLGISEAKVTVD